MDRKIIYNIMKSIKLKGTVNFVHIKRFNDSKSNNIDPVFHRCLIISPELSKIAELYSPVSNFLYCIGVFPVMVGMAGASPLGQFIAPPETTAKPSRPGHTRRED